MIAKSTSRFKEFSHFCKLKIPFTAADVDQLAATPILLFSRFGKSGSNPDGKSRPSPIEDHGNRLNIQRVRNAKGRSVFHAAAQERNFLS